MSFFKDIKVDFEQKTSGIQAQNKTAQTQNEDNESIFDSKPKSTDIDRAMDMAIRMHNISNTKDGKIGYTKQGAIGCCGLDAAVVAMSSTEIGAEMLDSAFEYFSYEATRLHTYLGDQTVYDKNLRKYTRSNAISKGDDDMGIIELGLQDTVDDILKGKYKISKDAPLELKYLKTQDLTNYREQTSSIEGIYPNAVFYLLTGKEGEYYSHKKAMNSKLDEFQNNNHKDLAMTAVTNFEDGYMGVVQQTGQVEEFKDVLDVEKNKKVSLCADHAFSVQEVTDDAVTLINPWDTAKSITISRDDFLSNFYIMCCDLSENNPEKAYIKEAK